MQLQCKGEEESGAFRLIFCASEKSKNIPYGIRGMARTSKAEYGIFLEHI
jgi:hypothetical protein